MKTATAASIATVTAASLRAEHTAWAQPIHAVFFRQGAPALGEARCYGHLLKTVSSRLHDDHLRYLPVGHCITLRLGGPLMHAIADNTLVRSWPYTISLDKRLALTSARQASGPLPPAPSGRAPRAERRVPRDGLVVVARQRLRVGASHAGMIVTIIAEDTHFRILDGEQELAIHPRKTNTLITRTKAWFKRR